VIVRKLSLFPKDQVLLQGPHSINTPIWLTGSGEVSLALANNLKQKLKQNGFIRLTARNACYAMHPFHNL